jgi:site-specific recombinase XerD
MGATPDKLFSQIGNKDLTLEKALEHFQDVYMPSRNFTERTREGYAGDIAQLVEFLTKAGVTRTRQVPSHTFRLTWQSLRSEGYPTPPAIERQSLSRRSFGSSKSMR